jgi:hypothetical protein
MMKFRTLAAMAAFSTLGSAAFAQAYVGIGVGRSHACISYDVVGDCTDSAATAKAFVGYTLPGTDFAIEGIYTHMGSFNGNSSFGGVDTKVDSLGVGGAWRPQFGSGWGGVVRGGFAYGKARSDFTYVQLGTPITTGHASNTDDYWKPYIGFGATYAVTANIRLEADLDLTRIGARSPTNVNSIMLGATYGF